MARLVLCVLALCAAGAFAVPSSYEKVDVKVLEQRQQELLQLYQHIHEPINVKKCQDIASTWSIEKNLQHYSNITAVKIYVSMLENHWYLPRSVPFSFNEPDHVYEAMTLFNVFYSAKDYETFYNTAVYLRDIVNEGLYVYVLNVAITYRHDTQGIYLVPIYEIFPSFFNNGEIMTTAQRVNTHGHKHVNYYPSTYEWDKQIVIRWNDTLWPYYDGSYSPVTYFTHDYRLNAFYYNLHVLYPHWLGCDLVPGLAYERRGEVWWFTHNQILARYYMERLSNGLSEIPDISEVVKDGYMSGLLYHNGIPFPSRPHNYYLNQHNLVENVEEVLEYERRIWESIEKGFVLNKHGEHINVLTEEGIDIIARLVEANADSPNNLYYKNFIWIWNKILGYNVHHHRKYYNNVVPLVLPAVLENYQTALRDPAFYMIWKRVLGLFMRWQKAMPLYKPEELAFPAVSIKKVDVDKLVTYFEYTYMDVSNHLFQSTEKKDNVVVLVQHPRLNHKPFSVHVHVKSDVAKTAIVSFFLAPKYDSKGLQIPLHQNTENWFLLDRFQYELTVGDCVITRESTVNPYTVKEWSSGADVYNMTLKGQWLPDPSMGIDKLPHHLLLPKGKVGGMAFQFIVYIQEYHAPKIAYGTGFDPKVSLGLGTGARFVSDTPLAFPADRPLHAWQIHNVHNLWFQDVLIYHKHAPEVYVPHNE